MVTFNTYGMIGELDINNMTEKSDGKKNNNSVLLLKGVTIEYIAFQ